MLIEGLALESGQGRAQNASNLFLFSAIFLLNRDVWMLSTCLFCHHIAVTFYYIWLLHHKAEEYLEACLSKLIYFCLFDLILPMFAPNCFLSSFKQPFEHLINGPPSPAHFNTPGF